MIATRIAALVLALFGTSSSALAQQSFVMDFDNIPFAQAGVPPPPPVPPIQDIGSAVLGYYDNDPVYGRTGSQPWDTTFGDNAFAIGSKQDPDGQGNFATAHSGLSAVGTDSSNSIQFGISPGLFISKLSFWYNAGGAGSDPALQLFSGVTSVYEQSLNICTNVGSDGFCGWSEFSVPDASLAGKLITRAVFFGASNKVVFDDMAVTTVPIPEPSTYALMLLGLAGVVAVTRRRAR